jgi:uncharacterized repeat protein (TIGR01451 family)
MTIQAHVLPDFLGPLHNDTVVSSATFDPDTANNLDTTVATVTASADLSITKTDSPDPVLAGNSITYTLTVTNAGPSTAQNVSVTDTIPAGTAFVDGVDGNGATVCALVLPDSVICDLGTMGPGEVQTVYITVEVDPSLPDGTILSNTATVTSSTPDPNLANNTAGATTTVNTAADLWLEKTGEQTAGNPAGAITYRITVHNEPGSAPDDTPTSGTGGPSDALNVVVTDPLPLTNKKVIVQFLSPSCTYDSDSHTVTCAVPVVPAGTAVTFEIQVDVKGSNGTLTNTASVTSSTADPTASNNSDTVNVVVQGSTGKGKKPN